MGYVISFLAGAALTGAGFYYFYSKIQTELANLKTAGQLAAQAAKKAL